MLDLVASIRSHGGFLTDRDLPLLAAHPTHRLTPILVRCGSCRFVAPAQDAGVLIAALEKTGNYVRDVSLSTSR